MVGSNTSVDTYSKSEDESSSVVPCNLCGSNEFFVLFKQGEAQINQIVRCKACGLMYANPLVNKPGVDEIMTWDPDFDVFTMPDMKVRYDKECLQIRDYRNSRHEMEKIYPRKGRLLEIGSSFGYGLQAWRDCGWDVVGVEPWGYGARYAKEKLGLTVHADILKNVHFEKESFDVISMLHVIEHVPNPLAELKEIFRILKPGGRFICETPTYDSLVFKLLGRRERSLSCDGHIFFFTVETLSALGRKAGFDVERVRLVGRSMTAQRLVDNIGIISKVPWFRNAARSTTRYLQFDRMPIYLNLKDMQRITFVKDIHET